MKTLLSSILVSLMLAVSSAQATPFFDDPTTIRENVYGIDGHGLVINNFDTTPLKIQDMDLLAHSGRTDSYGGHYNHRTGVYHFH